jgi:hypothetical protein
MLQLDDRLLCGWKNHTGQANSTQFDITVICAKTGRHDIAEILLKVALKHQPSKMILN